MDKQVHLEVELYSLEAHLKVILTQAQAIVEAMIVGVLVHLIEEVSLRCSRGDNGRIIRVL